MALRAGTTAGTEGSVLCLSGLTQSNAIELDFAGLGSLADEVYRLVDLRKR